MLRNANDWLKCREASQLLVCVGYPSRIGVLARSTDSSEVLTLISNRKLRLISAGIEREIPSRKEKESPRQAIIREATVAKIELLADGEIQRKDIEENWSCFWPNALEAVFEAVRIHDLRRDQPTVCEVIRDVAVNPFENRHVCCPEWRTASVVGLAETIYGQRDWALLPVLADALEDAGCQQMDLLDHCRQDRLHVKGCWVIDLLLGKD